MAIQHYSGKLGEFDYDDTQFQVMWAEHIGFREDKDNIVPGSNNIPLHLFLHKDYNEDFAFAGRGFNGYIPHGEYRGRIDNVAFYGSNDGWKGCWVECLHYIGNETDGLKIEIPKGIISCDYMFCETDIVSTPVIPDGVESCALMFYNCRLLKTASISIPHTVLGCCRMFLDCSQLIVPPILSSNTIDCYGMFANCEQLKYAPAIPGSARNCIFMFANCKHLRKVPIIQDSILEGKAVCWFMFYNCDNLEEFESQNVFEYINRCSIMFSDCTKLKFPEFSSSGEKVYYKGALGEFYYDPNVFQIQWYAFVIDENLQKYGLQGKPVFFLENKSEYECIECLRYIGWETDGSKIEIPKGIISCNHMFEFCNLITPPVIPDGVETCDFMFHYNSCLTCIPDIPETVRSCQSMFNHCFRLKTARIPVSVQNCDYMFAFCDFLASAEFVGISADCNVENCEGMFKNCFSLKHAPDVPNSVDDCYEMFLGCVNLLTASSIPENVICTMSMFALCESLVAAPAIPVGNTNEGVFSNHMFFGCKNLETSPPIPFRVIGRSYMFYGCDKLKIQQQNNDDTIVHYKGELGEFDYNPQEFHLMGVRCDLDLNRVYVYDDPEAENARECLHYIGFETDGSKIKIPQGITDCCCMFAGSTLVTPPIIPDGVTTCANMFVWSVSLESPPVIPESVKICTLMFGLCTQLKSAPVIPETVKNCYRMFYHCTSLLEAPIVPSKAYRCEMFEECRNLKDYEKQHELDVDTFDYSRYSEK